MSGPAVPAWAVEAAVEIGGKWDLGDGLTLGELAAIITHHASHLLAQLADAERRALKQHCCFAGVGQACPIHEK